MEIFDNEMEMPTSCQHCCEIFDLNDGRCSEKWYPNTIICENCWNKEQEEIGEDGRWEDINIDINNALYDIERKEAWTKLTVDNRKLITKLVCSTLMDKTEEYEEALREYLKEGINWGATANDVINCNKGNVEQLAADSFYEGHKFSIKSFLIWLEKAGGNPFIDKDTLINNYFQSRKNEK